MSDPQRAWLDSLDPDVRERAAAEIAYYDDPELWDFIEVDDDDDDWDPARPPKLGMVVRFNDRELDLINRGLDDRAIPLMKKMLLERAQAALQAREAVGSTTAAAD